MIFCSLPVSLSLAVTVRMPLASMSNVTSICGAPRGARPYAFQAEVAEGAVIARQFALALQHVDIHRGLVVLGRGEGFRLARGDGRVALDKLGHDAAERLQPERERRHVEQHDAFHFARQNARLDRRADRHHLVRIHRLVRFLAAGQPPHERLHGGHARCAADEDHLVDVALGDLGIRERLLYRPDAALDKIRRKLLELGPRELHLQVLRSRCIGGDERQADGGFERARKFDLRLLRRFGEPLQRLPVFAQIDALIALKFFRHPVHQPLVEIVAAQVRIARSRADFEDAVADIEDRDVEGAAAEIEHHDRFVLLLVETVGERRRSRLVDDPAAR